MEPRSFKLENLVYHELCSLVSNGYKRVLIPAGALEAHGAAGLGTDTIIPRGLAEALAPRLIALIAPAIPFGVLRTLRQYPGSVSLSEDSYLSLLMEIGIGLKNAGFRDLVFLNGHSGNRKGLKEAAFRLHTQHSLNCLVYDWYMEPDDATEEIYGGPGGHSGAAETGMVLAIEPGAAPKNIWKTEDAGTLNPAVSAYPGPYPIILEKEESGLPDYDPQKAEILFDKVVDIAYNSLNKILDRWNNME